MTLKRKQELLQQLTALFDELIETDEKPAMNLEQSQLSNHIEMITVKECTNVIKGLSENTVRQLISQDKLRHIRTGQGERGKILVNKADLVSYFNGNLLS